MVETILKKIEKKEFEGTECDKDDLENVLKNCFIASAKVLAIIKDSEQDNLSEINSIGYGNQEKICILRAKTLDSLHEEYMGAALTYVENLDASLDACSEPILLLNGLILLFKLRAPYLEEVQEKVTIVFKHCDDEAKVKTFGSISMVMLEWHATIKRPHEESCELLKRFLEVIVKPYITWQAGAHAEAMRSLAIGTLCSLSQGAEEEAPIVLPTFIQYIPNLLEDQRFITRYYTIKCLKNFGKVPMEQMRPVAYGKINI